VPVRVRPQVHYRTACFFSKETGFFYARQFWFKRYSIFSGILL